MTTTKRPQSTRAKQKMDSFVNVLNSFLGSGYKQKDIDYVYSQKKEFNVFYAKVPPVFTLSPWQVENGISAETKNFVTKTLYLLPESNRKELLEDDSVVNKIIKFYSENFETTLGISELDAEARKEILYQAWFIFRLMERHVLNGSLRFSKYEIFARIITRIMVDMIPLTIEGADEDPELNETIGDIVKIVEPKDYLDLYLEQTRNILAPYTSTDDIIDAANAVIEQARVMHEPTPTSQASLDKLAEMGFTTEQVEIVARYTLAKEKFKDNYVFASVEQLLIGLEPFLERAKTFGWHVKQKPNLNSEQFEQITTALYAMVDTAPDVDMPTFMGIFVPMCYSCLLVNADNESVFMEPTFTEFSVPMFKLFQRFTSASCEVIPTALPDTESSEPEEQNITETLQPLLQSASEQEAFSSTLSVPVLSATPNLSKENEMTNTSIANVIAAPAQNNESKITMLPSNEEIAAAQKASVTTSVATPTASNEKTVSFEEQIKKQFEDRNQSVDAGFAALQKQIEQFENNLKETKDRQVLVEQKVFGDESIPILERIRVQAKVTETSSHSSSTSLTTTETVVISAVGAVAVAAIGYSIYRVLND